MWSSDLHKFKRVSWKWIELPSIFSHFMSSIPKKKRIPSLNGKRRKKSSMGVMIPSFIAWKLKYCYDIFFWRNKLGNSPTKKKKKKLAVCVQVGMDRLSGNSIKRSRNFLQHSQKNDIWFGNHSDNHLSISIVLSKLSLFTNSNPRLISQPCMSHAIIENCRTEIDHICSMGREHRPIVFLS